MSSQVQTRETVSVAAAPAPRVDLYRMIHKTLRKMMFDTVYALGCADAADDREFHATLDQLIVLCEACDHHLQKETHYVHPAMEARSPGSTRQNFDEHFEHIREIDFIRTEVVRIRAGTNEAAIPTPVAACMRRQSVLANVVGLARGERGKRYRHCSRACGMAVVP